ncbi:prepilin-type N-terminal cleavage/methylation domain-containing protein [Pandoraea apista]|uniref:Type II secretion system protein H n=2 Tax=Pandoraea apista TaxID=93218 RepID=A0ABX9ZM34_9BURK|nr:prepilin-type N-terminal cleavage/methylation domain-containing protein [Pandoraea apista]RRJ32547.1 prepilin-type N-terminal cleavage/methylation domain-containing protein [Pandoraea apista]RRJ74266.1 prepilin-type N-terminal cleavage/methylation domain-containing protein [Pandoraea apista]RSD08832.1 prepilin-type N-terminal cleavage/methylation domain-containing protein [Pandoraea apista]RSD09702.1 prepilin-type N-terminal cleavage/methylation domain-containing protein [Pandoraea apista]
MTALLPRLYSVIVTSIAMRRDLRFARGVTMLECVIAMAVLAVALMAVSPSIDAVRHRVAVDVTARAFLASMQSARAEALGRHRRVAMAPHDGGSLSSGWVTFVDKNRNDRFDEGDQLLGRHAPLPPGVSVEVRWGLYNTEGLAFAENGFMRTETRGWLSGTVRIEGHGRSVCITINAYGRARVARRCSA